MDITKAKVVALPGMDGEFHVHNFITDIGDAAKHGSEEHTLKLAWVLKSMNFLSKVDRNQLPGEDIFETILDINIDGEIHTRKFELVKALRKVPIYELRIDLPEYVWFFRATFFPYYLDRQLHYCFVYPFEKIPGQPDPTNNYRDLTYQVLEDVRENPAPYFN